MQAGLLPGRWPGRWKVTEHDPVVIVGSARTAMGGFRGDLKSVAAPALGAVAIRAALDRAGLAGDQVDCAGGIVTAANSNAISDGAAALVLMRRSEAEGRGLAPLATIMGHATDARAPTRFTTAPIGALARLSEKTGWKLGDGRSVRDRRSLCRGRDGGHA